MRRRVLALCQSVAIAQRVRPAHLPDQPVTAAAERVQATGVTNAKTFNLGGMTDVAASRRCRATYSAEMTPGNVPSTQKQTGDEIQARSWGGRPARVILHGKKREHGLESDDSGLTRADPFW
jgi:hypothetical protein